MIRKYSEIAVGSEYMIVMVIKSIYGFVKKLFIMKNIIIICVSLLCSILLIPLRKAEIVTDVMLSMQLSLLIGSIFYFCVTLYFLNWYDKTVKASNIITFMLLGVLLLRLPYHVWKWDASLITLPDLFGHCLSIFIAFFFFAFLKNKSSKYLFLLFSLFLYVIFACRGYYEWFDYLHIQI